MRRQWLAGSAVAAAFGAIVLAGPAAGQGQPATVPTSAPAAAPRVMEVDYDIRLGVMGVVGEAKMRITVNGGAYSAQLTRQATGVARWAVGNAQDYVLTARGALTGDGTRPATYERKGGKRGRVVQVAFTGADVVTTATPALGSMGNPPATRAQKLEAVDDLSAFVAMAFEGGAQPCTRTVKVFDGRQRYDLAMTPNGAIRVDTRGFRGQAQRCSVAYRPVAGFTDPVRSSGPMTFVFAPIAPNVWAPTQIETKTEDGETAVLSARRVALALSWRLPNAPECGTNTAATGVGA